MYKKIIWFVLLLLPSIVEAQSFNQVGSAEVLQPFGAPADPDIQGLVWNKWTTENFTILSLDKAQGKSLFDNIENIKTWTVHRWGLRDVKFSAECRVFCVSTKDLLKKLFNLDSSHGEVRKNNGSIEISALWLVLDENPAKTIPPALTYVVLSEIEQQGNTEFGMWAKRGISFLNSTRSQIRTNFQELQTQLDGNQELFFSNGLFGITEDQFFSLSSDKKELFDIEAGILCLLLRKEFGQDNLLLFFQTKQSEEDLSRQYGFSDYQQFDATFKRYMTYLIQDAVSGRLPDTYIDINNKGDG